MITRSEQQLTNPSREYTIDPILQEHVVGPRAMSVDHVYNGVHNGMRPLRNHDQSFESQERHFVMGFNDEQTQDDAGLGETRKKKGSASSIANDQELRRLFRENHHRDLNDVAASVLANERGPRSEKTKQIFAMNW